MKETIYAMVNGEEYAYNRYAEMPVVIRRGDDGTADMYSIELDEEPKWIHCFDAGNYELIKIGQAKINKKGICAKTKIDLSHLNTETLFNVLSSASIKRYEYNFQLHLEANHFYARWYYGKLDVEYERETEDGFFLGKANGLDCSKFIEMFKRMCYEHTAKREIEIWKEYTK